MSSTYRKLAQEEPNLVHARFAKDVFLGLLRSQKVLSSKYMYNFAGTNLYEEIMRQPEYYLVESEYNCLMHAKDELVTILRQTTFNLVELGVGNGYKTKILLQHFLKKDLDFTYIPVDISEDAMKGLIEDLNQELPDLKTEGLVADYFDALEEIGSQDKKVQNLVLFLGSNIGNFSFDDAVDFIFTLWQSLNPFDYVLIGFDLRKDIDKMVNAYNDSKGVTSKFNLNVLQRINDELGANFDLSKFEHYEPYNVQTGAMESYLVSLENQEVFIEKLERSFFFKKWETIFMEHSYKYTLEDINNLAKITGFQVDRHFYDEKQGFVDSLWCTKKT